MWREMEDGRMDERKVCPFMSDPRGVVLCQGRNCAAAYPVRDMKETFWCCKLIEGHPGGNWEEP